jgi:flagellar hook assembly protein FlgD
VRSLWDAPAGAGAQSVVWDGRDRSGHRVPAGVYLTRLVIHSQVHAARIVRVE